MNIRRTAELATLACMSLLPQLGAAQEEAQASGVAAGGLEEVVVTAQRREESSQDVPVSVTTLSSQTLARMGIVSSEGLQVATPGLQYTNSGGFPQPFLRGVGNDRSANSEASVATYLDGVYIAFSAGTIQDLYDVERVEVVRGPQGTLYGRNATGGAINIVSKRPSRDFGMRVDLTGGSHDLGVAKLYMTGPFSETLAASLAVSGRRQDSFHHNVSSRRVPGFKEEETGLFGRGKLLWTPSDGFEAEFAADFAETFSFDASAYRQVQPNAIGFALGGTTGSKPYEVAFGEQVQSEVKQHGASLRMKADFGATQLVSISGYRLTDQYPQIELGGTDVTVFRADIRPTRSEQFSQELQLLSSPDSYVDWILGAYYFDEKQQNDPYLFTVVRPVGGVPVTVTRTATWITAHTESSSLFGQATIPLVGQLSLTGGYRYTWETRAVDDFRVTNMLVTPNTTTVFPGKSEDFTKPTFKGGLDYKLNEDVMFYASYSRGFKAGIFNLSNPIGDLGPVQPEVLDAYEIGTKADLLDRTLRLNVSAFHYDFENLQVTIVAPGTAAAILRNAATATMDGGEIELTAAPTERLRLGVGLAFLDAKYDEFDNFPLLTPAPAPGFGNISVPTDISGWRMMRSPRFTGTLNASYEYPLDNGGALRVGGTYYHNSGYNFDPGGVGKQKAYDTLDVSVSYVAPSGVWEIMAWGKNVTDERYLGVVQLSGNGTNYAYAPPATGGLTFTYSFGGGL